MKLLFKQRLLSWFDSYDIHDEYDNVVYTVQGKLSWGHCLHIHDQYNNHIGTVKEEVLTFLPKFELYENDKYIGCLKKEFSLFKSIFHLDCHKWTIQGDWLEWDYQILSQTNTVIATVSKEIFNWTDTYVIDVINHKDVLHVLMIVLAIDAEKCSNN